MYNICRICSQIEKLSHTWPFALISLWIFLGFSACVPVSQPNGQILTVTTPLSEKNTATSILPTIMPEEGISVSAVPKTMPNQMIPTVAQTPHHSIFGTSAPVTSTIESENHYLVGSLFLRNFAGIEQITVADGINRSLFEKEENWLDWGSRFAQNKKYLAYWINSNDGTELWVTSLLQWQPKRILTLKDVEFDFLTPLWAVNDRYLLFYLSALDKDSPLEDIKTLRTYIIDMENEELINQSYWSGDCSILAPSPLTEEIALWCFKTDNEESVHEFLILEPNVSPWITSQSPVPLTNNCYYSNCTWSPDGELVAYVVDGRPDSMFYTSVSDPAPVRLDDPFTNSYSFPLWSPNNQLLYYSGACADGTFECPVIISIPDQKIIWRAKNNYNKGEMGNISIDQIVWSPNSLYVAIPAAIETNSGIERVIIIFDVVTKREVMQIPDVNGLLDIVWTTLEH